MIESLVQQGIRDPRVLDAMSHIPRHDFLDPGMAHQAYVDQPLHIGHRQTISQPLMVALMTQCLQLKGHEKVLEIGTGSGYQTALLAALCKKVYSIERITSLSNKARQTLYRLAYMNFTLRIGDGSLGWPEEAPFDAIIVTAGAPKTPEILLTQIAPKGCLVFPRGQESRQMLVRVTRHESGYREEVLGECRFVKLIGEHGWPSQP